MDWAFVVSESTSPRLRRRIFGTIYVLFVLFFLVELTGFYHQGQGFTSMIVFGTQFQPRALPEVRSMSLHLIEGPGYDGQFYAQLAVRPAPWDPEIQKALDMPWYRGGRIFPIALAAGLSFGNAELAVNLYAVQYILVWLVLAAVLARWFPPSGVRELVAWAGVLFSSGVLVSVCRALPDAWGLLWVVIGLLVWQRERGAGYRGPIALALAALARETTLTSVAVFADRTPRSNWRRVALQVALIALPTLCWLGTLRLMSGEGYGGSNFGIPFAALIGRFRVLVSDAARVGWTSPGDVLWPGVTLLALVAQAAFFVVRIRPKEWTWRLGIANVALLALLGPPVLEGYPVAAARVLTPMLFAFNLAVPRTKWQWPLLVLGNLSVWSGWDVLSHPPG
jgi:hypothetical protein